MRGRERVRRRALALGVLFVTLSGADPQAQRPHLTGAPLLSDAYHAIFDARFDDVPGLLARACDTVGAISPAINGGRAPAETCELLEVVSSFI